MEAVPFFRAVTYRCDYKKSKLEKAVERVDDYFYLGGKKACIIRKQPVGRNREGVFVSWNSSILLKIIKGISYLTVFIPLCMLVTKAALRSRYNFKCIDPQASLEEGIDISSTIARIQQLIPKIMRGQDDPAITWLSTSNSYVFRLNEAPDFVFKLARGDVTNSRKATEARFANTVHAKEVCLVNDLGFLVIPSTKKFSVDVNRVTYSLIAEESVDFSPEETVQEELYHEYAKELNEAIRQLAIFVLKTRFNDVAWRNIPILNKLDEHGRRRIALIDLEHMKSIKGGIFGARAGGCGNSRGLIGSVFEEQQIDSVIEEVRKQGILISEEEVKQAKSQRLQEIESDEKLRAFYVEKNIKTGKEKIKVVHLDGLELNLAEEGRIKIYSEEASEDEEHIVTLEKAVTDVVKQINRQIRAHPDQESNKGKRCFYLRADGGNLLYQYDNLYMTKDGKKGSWLHYILKALVDKCYIFKVTFGNNRYLIQA